MLGAGILGFSLFCLVAAAALTDPRVPNVSDIQPQNIVDSAVSNINTMAALTVVVITQYVSPPTDTVTPSPVPTITDTNTATRPPTRTLPPPTRTRKPGSTATPTKVPTNTSTKEPTNTPT